MPLQVTCSNTRCKRIIACSSNLLGKHVQCLYCGTLTPVLEEASSPAIKRLGHYSVLRKIGEGGMGEVYEASQDGLDRRVAIKVLSTRLMKDANYLKRFQREAKLAASLDHPNIVQVHEIGEDSGLYFFSMQFVDGETLLKRLDREKKIAAAESLAIVTKVAEALHYAWNHAKLIHRDIKPDNILITPEGEVKLADLGLAKRTGDDLGVTAEGTALGTPAYMAPEQGRGRKNLDCRSDIYSLGITLFHMITGQCPFVGPSSLTIQLAHEEVPLPDPKAMDPSIPDNVRDLLKKMCAKQPEDRYQTHEELLADLERVRSGEPLAVREFPAAPNMASVEALAGGRAAPGRKRVAMLARIAVAGLLAVGGITFAVRPPATSPRHSAGPAASPTPEPVPKNDPSGGNAQGSQPVNASVAEVKADAAAPKPTQSSDTRVQDIYEYAASYAREHPDEFDDLIAKFQRVEQEAKGTKYALMAEDERKRLEIAREARAAEVWGKISSQVESLADTDRFAEAFEALERLPENLKPYLPAEKTAAARKALYERALRRFETIQAEGEKLIEAQRLGEARQDFERLRGFGIPSLTDAAQEKLQEISGLELLTTERTRIDLLAAYQKKLEAIEFLARNRQYEEALKQLDALAAEARFQPMQARIARDRRDVQRAEAVLQSATRSLEKQIGKHLSVDGSIGNLVQVASGQVVLSGEGKEVTKPICLLPAKKIAALAVSSMQPSQSETALALAIFWSLEGDDSEAEKGFIEALDLGADATTEPRLAPILELVSHPAGASFELQPDAPLGKTQSLQNEAPGSGPEVNSPSGSDKPITLQRVTPARLQVSRNTAYAVKISKEGYDSLLQQVNVSNNGEYRVVVALNQAQLPLNLRADFELPPGFRDARGSPIRKGFDKDSALPLEIRHRQTGMHFLLIPAGEFEMGSPENEKERQGDEMLHTVAMTHPFYMGKYEVSFKEFERFARETGSITEAERGGGGWVWTGTEWAQKPDASWRKPYFEQQDDSPVVLVSWNDTQKFLEWLNAGGQARFHLPTETQWEYACRAATRTRFFWGEDESLAARYANVGDRSLKMKFPHYPSALFDVDDGTVYLAAVGLFSPNPYGLYDMTGNAWEWCADWYDPNYYRVSPKENPKGPEKGSNRVFRGGSWVNDGRSSRSAFRSGLSASGRFSFLGFRVVRTL